MDGSDPRAEPVDVLVVEPNRRAAQMAQARIEAAGYRVRREPDGEAALSLVDEVRPRLLVAEVLLPSLDGLSLCRRLRARAPDGPSVILWSFLAASERARDSQADLFLLKPVAPRTLVRAVEKLLGRPR